MKISDSKLFSRPGSIERLIWPSREEIDYLKSLPKNILKSKIFWVGIGVFLLYLISDISVKVFIPKEMVYLFLPKVCFANFYHSSSPIVSFIALLIIIRVLLFLRFKTWWRTNKFLDAGFAIFLGAILARTKDLQGSVNWIWIQLGKEVYVSNLIDIFIFLGLFFLLIGVIICSKSRS